MDEYGIFSDEGCVEAQYWSVEEAESSLAELLEDELLEDEWSEEDHLVVRRICSEHDEQPADECEFCHSEYG